MKYFIDEKNISNYKLLYSQCNTKLDEKSKKDILTDLNDGLEDYDVFQYFNAQPTIFKDYDHLVISKDTYDNDKTIGLIGVKCFENENVKFLYFWSAMINKKYHKTRLIYHLYSWLLKKVFLHDGFFNIIATKTYNPIIYDLFLRNKLLLGDEMKIYPIIGDKNDPQMLTLAENIFNLICPDLELDIQSGCVKGGQGVLAPNFFPNLPHCKNQNIYNHFKNNLTSNDQVLTILKIPRNLEDIFKNIILR